MYAIRWIWYLLRLNLFNVMTLLRFISRPSSRFIFVILIVAAAYLLRDTLHEQITAQLQEFDPGFQPEGLLLDVILVVSTLLTCAAFAIVSGLLKIVLGAFRVGMRPLPPLRKLKPTTTKISSAVVRIVVPPLPKRMPG